MEFDVNNVSVESILGYVKDGKIDFEWMPQYIKTEGKNF